MKWPLQAPVNVTLGAPIARLDARLKVTGAARYGSDMSAANAVYAFLATSAIARGRIVSIDDRRSARACPACSTSSRTARSAGAIKPGGFSSKRRLPLLDNPAAGFRQGDAGWPDRRGGARRQFRGGARGEAPSGSTFAMPKSTPSAGFDSPGTETVAAKDVSPEHEDPKVGDAEKAFADAEVKIDVRYETPTQHHNPIELFTTMCAWDGGKLTIWESSQNVTGFKFGVAEQLGDLAEGRARHFALCRGRIRLARRPDAPNGADRGRRQAPRTPRQARRDARAGLHHRDLPRRNAPARASGREPRRQAAIARPRRLGDHEPT